MLKTKMTKDVRCWAFITDSSMQENLCALL
jgi:hypothetical protein